MMLYTAVLLVLTVAGYCAGRSPNIINGDDVEYPGKYPYQVSLQYKTKIGKSGFHFCGASILNRRWLLTASHCVEDTNAGGIQAVVGMHDKGFKQGKPKQYFLKRHIMHEDYKFPVADIALIELKTDIEYNKYVQPIRIGNKDDFDHKSECVITGWGRTTSEGGHPWILQEAPTSLLPESVCRKHAAKDVICIKNSKTQACKGDSGGPLVCRGPGEEDTWQLLGDTSYGPGGCSIWFLAGYINAHYYIDWITSYTGELYTCTVGNCEDCGLGVSICNKCVTGFASSYDGLRCEACSMDNCEACDDVASTCTQCLTGFAPNADGSLCEACTMANCEACDDVASICTKCSSGFGPSADGLQCEACAVDNCEKCGNGASTCTKCATNYKPNADKTICEEKLWRSDGKCGRSNPLSDGKPSQCNPTNSKAACCSSKGWCGNTWAHCKCRGCIDYSKSG